MARVKSREAGAGIENSKLVIEALAEKLGENSLVCPLSHDSNWEVQGYFAALPAVESFPQDLRGLPSQSYPLAVLLCKTCGFTFFVNLITLGIADQVGIEVSDD